MDIQSSDADENDLKSKFNRFMDAAMARYLDSEAVKCLKYISGLFHICFFNDNEKLACEQLIIRCEEICYDKTTSNIKIYKPLNELGQFLTRIRKKQIELKTTQSTIKEVDTNHPSTSKNSDNSTQTKRVLDKTISNSMEIDEENSSSSIEQIMSEKDLKALARIEKLDKKLMELSDKIIEYENAEVSFQSESIAQEELKYEIESRLKKRWMEGHQKLIAMCKKYNHLIEPDVKLKKCVGGQFKSRINFNYTRYEEINTEITMSLNKQKQFPDYQDVFNWISKANTESNLNLDSKKIESLSKESFEEIGRILKILRIQDDTDIHHSRLVSLNKLQSKVKVLENSDQSSESNSDFDEKDPAKEDKILDEKLKENEKTAKEREKKLLEEFVEKQQKNEAENIHSETESNEDPEEEIKSESDEKEAFNESVTSDDFNVENDITDEEEIEENINESLNGNINDDKIRDVNGNDLSEDQHAKMNFINNTETSTETKDSIDLQTNGTSQKKSAIKRSIESSDEENKKSTKLMIEKSSAKKSKQITHSKISNVKEVLSSQFTGQPVNRYIGKSHDSPSELSDDGCIVLD